VLAAGGVDTHNVLQPIAGTLAAAGIAAPGAPSFIVFVAGILVALAALVLWIELVVRAAAVTAAALFLPLALAGLVFPAVSHWCRRLADTLAALVLSKLVVAAVLSLAAGAIAGGLGVGARGSGGFASIVTGVALLAMAAFSPFTLLKLVPAVEAGAVAHLASARHQAAGGARAAMRAGSFAADVAAAVTPEGAILAGATADVGAGAASIGGAHDLVAHRAGVGAGASGPGGADAGWEDDAYGIPVLQGTPGGWEEIERLLQRYAPPDATAPADASEDPDVT
jgi:hypothetical protein